MSDIADVTMQGIEFQIVNDSEEAAKGLDSLSRALTSLKTATGAGANSLSRVATGIEKLKKNLEGLDTTSIGTKLKGLSDALGKLNVPDTAKISASLPKNITALNTAVSTLDTSKITSLGTALGTIGAVGRVNISAALPKNIRELATALDEIKWTDQDKLSGLADGLRPLSELGRSNLTSFINQLNKLPEVVTKLDAVDMGKFVKQMQDLSVAIKPLADEMNKVAAGFSAFPSRIQRLITSTERYNNTVRRATTHTNAWGNALKTISLARIYQKAVSVLEKSVAKSSEYTETLNMFTVSMGQYAQEAYDYAQKVSDVLGIDPATWMENQGVFNSIITGFGVAGDKAAVMSKNLNQLAYDLSSFYNISVEAAMQKVQSGISGELEPLNLAA